MDLQKEPQDIKGKSKVIMDQAKADVAEMSAQIHARWKDQLFVDDRFQAKCMSGAELALRIKEQMPDLPLVAVSGGLVLWDPDDLADLGFDHVFSKPLNREEFVRICGEICAGDIAVTRRLAEPRQ